MVIIIIIIKTLYHLKVTLDFDNEKILFCRRHGHEKRLKLYFIMNKHLIFIINITVMRKITISGYYGHAKR